MNDPTNLDDLIATCHHAQLEAGMVAEVLRYILRNEFDMDDKHIELLFEVCRAEAKDRFQLAADAAEGECNGN